MSYCSDPYDEYWDPVPEEPQSFGECLVVVETKKAYLVWDDCGTFWVPKALVIEPPVRS